MWKRPWLYIRYYFGSCLEETKEKQEKSYPEEPVSRPRLQPGPSEQEVEAQTTEANCRQS
jgi:hypothetical protein